ncbi:MAG: ABC-F family ATP-binding cassette domain-containing protein [Bacillota bacterium]
MSILQVNNLTKYFGSREIFSDLSFEISAKEKTALVGANGSGKTTLLNILVGEEKEDDGDVFLASGTSLGYLAQNKDFTLDLPLWDFLSEPLAPIYNCERDLLELSQKIPKLKGNDLERALDKYNKLHLWYEAEDGYSANARLSTIYNGLGFMESDKTRSILSFSGGERTRVELARKLLEKPNLLILDEPTNHLDASTILWLESFLKSYPYAILVVSHDRYFLDEIVQKVLYLKQGRVRLYRGNYSDFRSQLEQQEMDLDKAYTLQQAYIKNQRKLIDEARETEKAQKFAKSKEKRLEKLDLIEKPITRETMRFDFPFVGRSGKIALRADSLTFSYDNTKKIVNNATFTINYGDRVALLGPNGSGKTTLFKLILGNLKPNSGSVNFGASVEVSYFSQIQEFINEDDTVLDELLNYKRLTIGDARDHLAKFLFKGEDVQKRVSSLSGGEKSRLILAKLALTKGNLLLFDEPTNHLDIDSLETLENAMLNYPGTIFFISHDRYLVSKIARQVMEISDGTLTLYPFGYRDYLQVKKENNLEVVTKSTRNTAKKTTVIKRERPRKIEQEKEKVLQKIKVLEEEKFSATENLKDGKIADNWEKLAALEEKIAKIDEELTELYESWVELEEVSP